MPLIAVGARRPATSPARPLALSAAALTRVRRAVTFSLTMTALPWTTVVPQTDRRQTVAKIAPRLLPYRPRPSLILRMK